MSTDTADGVDWEAIARRELAEAQLQFFEGEIEPHLSAHLRELRQPGAPAAEREALVQLLHRLSTLAQDVVEDARDLGTVDDDEAEVLADGARALGSAGLVVGDRDQ